MRRTYSLILACAARDASFRLDASHMVVKDKTPRGVSAALPRHSPRGRDVGLRVRAVDRDGVVPGVSRRALVTRAAAALGKRCVGFGQIVAGGVRPPAARPARSPDAGSGASRDFARARKARRGAPPRPAERRHPTCRDAHRGEGAGERSVARGDHRVSIPLAADARCARAPRTSPRSPRGHARAERVRIITGAGTLGEPWEEGGGDEALGDEALGTRRRALRQRGGSPSGLVPRVGLGHGRRGGFSGCARELRVRRRGPPRLSRRGAWYGHRAGQNRRHLRERRARRGGAVRARDGVVFTIVPRFGAFRARDVRRRAVRVASPRGETRPSSKRPCDWTRWPPRGSG